MTRPGSLRHTSANRLAAVVAANNNTTAKLQPLIRSKTTDPSIESRSTEIESPKTVTSALAPERPFHSAIYCSRSCAQLDAGRSEAAYLDIARTLSYDFANGFTEPPLTPGLPVHVTDHRNPDAPPSPLFVSSSDTESSNVSNLDNLEPAGPACSAPKMMEYFRMSRDGSDWAWPEMSKQRRSSAQPAIRPTPISREASRTGTGDISTDSLSSLWNQDQELYPITRSGKMKSKTPVYPDCEVFGTGKRSMSPASDRSAPIPTRPLPRSNLSQTSLATSPASAQAIPIPPGFGSAPNHTLSLFQSYASAFPVRDHSGTSTSYSQKGIVFPDGLSVSPAELRRGSFTTALSRSGTGTVKARSRAGYEASCWDSFGRDAVAERKTSAVAMTERGRREIIIDGTPKQSLEVENGRWKIKYTAPTPGDAKRSTSRSSDNSRSSFDSTGDHPQHANGVSIPGRMQRATSSTSSAARTPQPGHMPPPSSIPRRPTSQIPDIAGLCVGFAGFASPPVSQQTGSAPRASFNWDKLEQSGGKTYELPKSFNIDRSKGLFYFQ